MKFLILSVLFFTSSMSSADDYNVELSVCKVSPGGQEMHIEVIADPFVHHRVQVIYVVVGNTTSIYMAPIHAATLEVGPEQGGRLFQYTLEDNLRGRTSLRIAKYRKPGTSFLGQYVVEDLSGMETKTNLTCDISYNSSLAESLAY